MFRIITLTCLLMQVVCGQNPIRPFGMSVQNKFFPVVLSDGNNYTVRTRWYRDTINNDNCQNIKNEKSIHVLVHGSTYSYSYWDADQLLGDPVDYSYANYMTSTKNYNLLAIDLIGTGASNKPSNPDGLNGTTLGIEDTASSLNQIIQNLKQTSNILRSNKYEKIILIGHSNGAIVSAYTQAKYNNSDILVMTGKGFEPSPLVSLFDSDLGKFLISTLYTKPYLNKGNQPPAFLYSLRPFLFYHWPTTNFLTFFRDPEVLSSTMAEGQMKFATDLGLLPGKNQSEIIGTMNITIPVLIQFGEFDYIAPGSLANEEYKYWNNSINLEIQILNNIGHVFNLHKNNKDGWNKIDTFVRNLIC